MRPTKFAFGYDVSVRPHVPTFLGAVISHSGIGTYYALQGWRGIEDMKLAFVLAKYYQVSGRLNRGS